MSREKKWNFKGKEGRVKIKFTNSCFKEKTFLKWVYFLNQYFSKWNTRTHWGVWKEVLGGTRVGIKWGSWTSGSDGFISAYARNQILKETMTSKVIYDTSSVRTTRIQEICKGKGMYKHTCHIKKCATCNL